MSLTTQSMVETEAEAAQIARAEARPVPKLVHLVEPQTENADHFIERDGVVFAGHHLIIDLWDAEHLNDIARIEAALKRAVEAAKATLLHIHLHHFTPEGVSGVAVLAESHISIHTWPERGYAALDVFMCGDAEPLKCVPVLEEAFKPSRVAVNKIQRGVVTD